MQAPAGNWNAESHVGWSGGCHNSGTDSFTGRSKVFVSKFFGKGLLLLRRAT